MTELHGGPGIPVYTREKCGVRTHQVLINGPDRMRLLWRAETTSPPRGLPDKIGVDNYRTEIGALLALIWFYVTERWQRRR